MPFIGRDWRSPGEAWIKTDSLGWQRMKIIESQLFPSCHQNPACSWPPKSEFGQHMAKHCKQHEQNHHTTTNSQWRNNSLSSNVRSSSSSSSSGSSSDSDSSNSRAGSTSPSPACSPEKSVHHSYPVTISSPYGQYSCCAHHLESTHLPMSSLRGDLNMIEANRLSTAQATTMSRSLSRESVITGAITPTQPASPYDVTRNQKMRYNNSVSDFRNSSVATNKDEQQEQAQQQKPQQGFLTQSSTSTSQASNTRCESQFSDGSTSNEAKQHTTTTTPSQRITPILMKNDCKLDDTDTAIFSDNQQLKSHQQQEQTTSDEQDKREQTASPAGSTSSTSSSCCCCSCCCSCCSLNAQFSQAQSACLQKDPSSSSSAPYMRTAPHCRISVRTREVAMYNTISEAFYRLDFCNAIHDIRRFNYICKLLHLLITQNLTSLSGCATKVLFTMLEQVAWEVSSNKRNIHVLKNLLNELRQMIQKYYCWGRPIGSRLLWQQHFDTIERISQMVDRIELSPPKKDNDQITFNSLPVEMIREILLRLNDYRDLVNSAQASPVMRTMIDGQYIWRQLCKYHFTEQQLKCALDNYNGLLYKKTANSARGVKYAKTSSADGKTSYRNPVVVHNKKQQNQSSAQPSTTRQQQQHHHQQQQVDEKRDSSNRAVWYQQQAQTSGDISEINDENQKPEAAVGAAAATTVKQNSYVTRAIRIFDKDGGRVKKALVDEQKKPLSTSNKLLLPSTSGQSLKKSTSTKDQKVTPSEAAAATAALDIGQSLAVGSNLNRTTNHDIDWERIFHQLRKKYDLKEEYADCLLLCRHCRCLFWKSFGHPCIKSANFSSRQDGENSLRSSADLRFNDSRHNCLPINNNQSVAAAAASCSSVCDGINCTVHNDQLAALQREQPGLLSSAAGQRADDQLDNNTENEHNSSPSSSSSSRLSVAALSRNFDNRAALRLNRVQEAENVPPESSNSTNNNGIANAFNDDQRSFNNNLGQQLRNINIRLATRRRSSSSNNNNSSADNSNSNSGSSSRRQQQAASVAAASSLRRSENLVPEHVAISPQAFLKFFSL